METEEWKSVPDYPLYEASTLGRLRRAVSRRNWAAGRIKRSSITRSGYSTSPYEVTPLTQNGRAKTVKVHRIIAATFLGPPPVKWEVNHKDGNGLNNRVDNLEYVAGHGPNMSHAIHTGLKRHTRGELNGNAKLNDESVIFIRAHPEIEAAKLATQFGVSRWTVYKVRSRTTTTASWGHIQ